MATNFPSSLDLFTNPTAVDTLDSPPHDTQHADANDAIEAIQAKVGVDSSAVTTSLDYRVGQMELGGGSMTTSSSAPSSPSTFCGNCSRRSSTAASRPNSRPDPSSTFRCP